MTLDDILRMAREAGLQPAYDAQGAAIERFAALVAAAERKAWYIECGTLMFNPYTGVPRHPEDIASDPHGIMLLDPEQPIAAAIRARGNHA